jgi:hypothetical protein
MQQTKTTKKGRLQRETGIIFKEAAVSKKEKKSFLWKQQFHLKTCNRITIILLKS